MTLGEIYSQISQNPGKGQPLRREPPRECALTHAQPASNFAHLRLSMRIATYRGALLAESDAVGARVVEQADVVAPRNLCNKLLHNCRWASL